MNPFTEHRLKVARASLRMPDAMLGVMGGPSKEEAAEILREEGTEMGERYVQVLFVVPLAIPASMLEDGGWIEKQALDAIARGDWELEEEAGK